MTIKSRLDRLEKQTRPQDVSNRVVVVYRDQVTAAELEALETDPSIGTLIFVEYKDSQPKSTITAGNYSISAGVDLERI